MTPETIQATLRSTGLCGEILPDSRICIQAFGHEGCAHAETPEDYDAALIRIAALEKRQQELLATIVRITNETPFPDEVKSALEQRGKLLAEVGTLRAKGLELDEQKTTAYRERNRLVAALAWFALDTRRRRGVDPDALWFAGVGRHQPDPDPTWDADWLTVIFIDTPQGQMSWHVHDSDRPLFEGLPSYHTPWDGHTTEEKYERLGKLFR